MTRIPHFTTLRRIARVLQIAQVTALALLLALGAMLWRNIEDVRRADGWVDHSYDVQSEIDQVRASVLYGGLALRNFFISPRPEFLDTIARSAVTSNEATARLLDLVSDHPGQTVRAHQIRSETQEVVGWYRSSETIARRDGVPALQASLAGRVNIDASFRLRELLDDMDAEERLLLESRRQDREAGFRSVQRWSMAVGLVFVLFAVGAIAYAGRLVGLGESNLKALHADAQKDPLTGLANRRAIDRAAQMRRGMPMAVIGLDLDDFKPVNDRFGHAAGDHVLRTVASRLQSQSRDGDVVARTGGDEFVMLLPGLHDAKTLEAVAARIRSAVADPIDFNGSALRVGASVGFACSDGSLPFEQLAEAADAMSYANKRSTKSARG